MNCKLISPLKKNAITPGNPVAECVILSVNHTNMTKITVHANLKNSTRKELLKDFNIAFATGNADFIVDHVSDDIKWTIHGDKQLVGKEQFKAAIDEMKDYVADEVVIHNIITHGAEAAANGEMSMGGETYAFCDVYRFTSAGSKLIKEMNSYVVKTN